MADTMLKMEPVAGYLEDESVSGDSTRELVSEAPSSEPPPSYSEECAEGSWEAAAHCHPAVTAPVDHSAVRTLAVVSALTVIFILVEFTGAILSGSVALMTDAAHMLSDLFSFFISIIAIYIGRQPASKNFSFGLYRSEIIGAIVSILVIWVLTGILVYIAILRCINPDFPIEADYMIGTAAAGVVFNIIMGVVLHKGGHGHSHGLPGSGHGHSHANPNYDGGHGHGHGHSHAPPPPPQPEPEVSLETGRPRRTRKFSVTAYPTEDVVQTTRTRNINVRAAFVHVIGDLFQSIGVLIAATIIYFKPEYKLADPICTFIFSVLVMVTTVTVMRDALRVLMEGTPRDVDFAQLKADLETIRGVQAAHSLHMWSLTMDKAALAVHLAIRDGADGLDIQKRANKMMRYKYNVVFTTIQVEPYDAVVMSSCPTCIGPPM